MLRDRFGCECKVCLRPFTSFSWRPAGKSRTKKTLICATCAAAQNVCQSCVFDLEFGLPVQVRDRYLGIADDTPRLEENRAFFFEGRNRSPVECFAAKHRANGSAGRQALLQISRAFHSAAEQSAANRNRPFVCSFWVRGVCNRGASCPYSHDVLAETEANRTRIMNRYFGVKDPVAEQIFESALVQDLPPALFDRTITSVCLHGVESPSLITEAEVRGRFERFGDISSVVVLRSEKVAFVNFVTRDAADQAVGEFLERPVVVSEAHPALPVTWAYGKPRGLARDFGAEGDLPAADTEEKLPLPGAAGLRYESMQRNQIGASVKRRGRE